MQRHAQLATLNATTQHNSSLCRAIALMAECVKTWWVHRNAIKRRIVFIPVADLWIILQILKILVAMANRLSVRQLQSTIQLIVHFGVLINVQAFAISIQLRIRR
jgi:hypothetical protein